MLIKTLNTETFFVLTKMFVGMIKLPFPMDQTPRERFVAVNFLL